MNNLLVRAVPYWANYLAQDKDGWFSFYKHLPHIGPSDEQWIPQEYHLQWRLVIEGTPPSNFKDCLWKVTGLQVVDLSNISNLEKGATK